MEPHLLLGSLAHFLEEGLHARYGSGDFLSAAGSSYRPRRPIPPAPNKLAFVLFFVFLCFYFFGLLCCLARKARSDSKICGVSSKPELWEPLPWPMLLLRRTCDLLLCLTFYSPPFCVCVLHRNVVCICKQGLLQQTLFCSQCFLLQQLHSAHSFPGQYTFVAVFTCLLAVFVCIGFDIRRCVSLLCFRADGGRRQTVPKASRTNNTNDKKSHATQFTQQTVFFRVCGFVLFVCVFGFCVAFHDGFETWVFLSVYPAPREP